MKTALEENEKLVSEIVSEGNDFDKLVKKLIKEKRRYFVVCRNTYTDELFYIEFENREQVDRFVRKNHGDIYKIGFYAEAFVDGKYYDENT